LTLEREPRAVISNERIRKVLHDAAPNGRAFSGEPSERSERPERSEGRRVRCNAMLGGGVTCAISRAERSTRWYRRTYPYARDSRR
jgi:hypothetical protein